MNTLIETDMVRLPSGTFLMGENEEDKYANDTERPRHKVQVAEFEIGRNPVTVGQFRAFRPDHEPGVPEDWPVASVSWEDAQEYCQWLGWGYRLPTEAEWEFAARGGTQSPYPHGTVLETEHANFYYDEKGNRIGPGHRTPVGSYPANGFGLCDMLGNVCEWVEDAWSHMYDSTWEESGSVNQLNTHRVLRGGAWDYLP
ncbi:MAG: formylglycine-generating enzyme family protein, partial [Puniceicoccales bacterium]